MYEKDLCRSSLLVLGLLGSKIKLKVLNETRTTLEGMVIIEANNIKFAQVLS